MNVERQRSWVHWLQTRLQCHYTGMQAALCERPFGGCLRFRQTSGNTTNCVLIRIYVPDDIELKVQMSVPKQTAFHDPPSCPFYSYALGNLSPYGDEVLPLLSSLIGACAVIHTLTR